MLILKGTKTVDLSKDELTEIIGQFDRVHIDLGTGDGRNIYKLAINDQNTFYNQVGLDFENNPPTTVEEFLSACETIKAKGIVPITAGDYECNDFFSTLVSKWWMQDTGVDSIKQHGSNKTSFSSDQGFINACSIVQDMWNAGYIHMDLS